LVELIGSKIQVESELGKESMFRFTFAAHESPSSDVEPQNKELLEGVPGLVIDDNATNPRIIGHMLADWRMNPLSPATPFVPFVSYRNGHSGGTLFR
jgi:two-component system, sensor histidine kinase and response regulator